MYLSMAILSFLLSMMNIKPHSNNMNDWMMISTIDGFSHSVMMKVMTLIAKTMMLMTDFTLMFLGHFSHDTERNFLMALISVLSWMFSIHI